MYKKLLSTSLLLLIGICIGFGQKKIKNHYLTKTLTAEEIRGLTTKLNKVYYMFAGHFSNKAQADTSTTGLFKEQEIICVPIWQKRSGEYWLYMSWYPANNIESPLSQMVYRIDKFARDTFTLERFNLPPAMRGTIWKEAKAIDKFKPADLIATGCVNLLVVKGSDEFYAEPKNKKELCKEVEDSPFAYVQTELSLSPEYIVLYNTFYDAQKEILFTQKPGGVHFTRSDKNNPKYLDILYAQKKRR